MAETLTLDVESVSKLKRRLHDAAHQQKQEVAILKVLNRLSIIHMTLEILKITHIGKEVNSLRKWDGEVGEKARALVRKWKQLLPDSDNASSSSRASGSSSNAVPTLNGTGESTTSPSHNHSHSQLSHRKKKGERRLEAEGDTVDAGVAHTSDKLSAIDGLAESSNYDDDFSKALMIPGHIPGDSRRHRHKQKHKHSSTIERSKSASASEHDNRSLKRPSVPTSAPQEYLGVPPTISNLIRPKSPPVGSLLDTPSMPGSFPSYSYSPKVEETIPTTVAISRKRKANLESSTGAVALTKRSRTQVYSGKRSLTGPQVVPSLFDQAMRVLMDNIDDIGEVGGVPFFILEPVLQKCTPTQLMRLEEYNEHFVEDSDPLWEKHCLKEFKGCRPAHSQSWRDLYIERLAQREEKLKSLAATIKAKEQARQEPVRKAMLADVSRMPARRRRACAFKSRRLEEEHSASTSKLGNLRKKMAKQIQMMRVYKPGRR